MSQRGFGGITTLPSTPIPVYGTTVASQTALNPDLFSGNTGAASNRSSCVVSVAAGTAGKFRQGDHVAIGTLAQFEQGNTSNPDGGVVQSVNASGNTITVIGLTKNHAAGEFVVLALPVAAVGIQVLSASSTSIYIAEDGTAGVASPTLMWELSAGSIFQFGTSNVGNVLETSHLWIQGGAGSQYIPSLVTI